MGSQFFFKDYLFGHELNLGFWIRIKNTWEDEIDFTNSFQRFYCLNYCVFSQPIKGFDKGNTKYCKNNIRRKWPKMVSSFKLL